jgi:non-ribosomal peptide synthetase component F
MFLQKYFAGMAPGGLDYVLNLLHEFFENTADRFPDRIAVQSGNATFTYRFLDESANRLAHLLRQHGAGPENCVGILLPRNEQLYCAMLAILKAGAAYLPIDPETPPERIRHNNEGLVCSARLCRPEAIEEGREAQVRCAAAGGSD